MKKSLGIIDTAIKYFLVILVAVVSVLGFYQVITRYALNNPSTWSEEAIRFLFIWASCVGGGIGVKEHIHIGIDALINLLPASAKRVTETMVYILLIIFGLFMTKYGMKLVNITGTQVSPALQVSMGLVYFSIPTFGILTVYYSLLEIIKLWRKSNEDDENVEAGGEQIC